MLGMPYATQIAVSQPFNQYGRIIQLCTLSRVSILLTSLYGGVESSFLDLVPPNDAANSESVVAINPGDSGMLIGYHVNEFTHTWSAEHFIVQSKIYLGLQTRCQI